MSNNRDYEAMNIALLLSRIFKLMPASVVKSIEVITNPEAKDDVEGVVGILNLVMNAPRGQPSQWIYPAKHYDNFIEQQSQTGMMNSIRVGSNNLWLGINDK